MTFAEWKTDLEDRLAKYLFEHPEQEEPEPSLYNRSPRKVDVDPAKKVEVRESSVFPGLWSVWKNGIIVEQFKGPFAQRSATSYANKILNGGGF